MPEQPKKKKKKRLGPFAEDHKRNAQRRKLAKRGEPWALYESLRAEPLKVRIHG